MVKKSSLEKVPNACYHQTGRILASLLLELRRILYTFDNYEEYEYKEFIIWNIRKNNTYSNIHFIDNFL